MPRHISGWGRSRCPHCSHKLPIWDVLPLISYLLLRGRCRFCKEKISPRYFFVELAGGLISAGFLFCWGPFWGYIGGLVLLTAGLTAVVSDLDSEIIPDRLNLVLAVCGVALVTYKGMGFLALWGLTGAAAAFLIFRSIYFLTKRIGGGDVKFLTAAGFTLGPLGVCLGILFASLSGLLVELLLRRRHLGEPFPFGPYLTGGCFAAWAVLPLIFKFKGGI